MLVLPRTTPRLPAGWPQERYEEYHRARKTARIIDHLLSEQLVHAAEQATDSVITAAARDIAAGPKAPSPTTCQAVRDTLAALIPTPLPPLDSDAALDALQNLLSGADWNPSHMEQVASILRATGRTIADTDH
ncbi:hypothetical protein [Kitasatospora sp. NPDC058478]|uniref:hypothetical protein n=1 Tax=unclassified Kitasatospora TaxID=2633591 RepID=UPI00365A7E79